MYISPTHLGELLLSETSGELRCQPFTSCFFFFCKLFVCCALSLSLFLCDSLGLFSHSVSFILQCLHLGYITMRTHAA